MTRLYFYVMCVAVLAVVLFMSRGMRNEAFEGKEGFGMSPGTMDQLQSTSVPRALPGIYQAPIWVDGFKDVNAKPDQALEDAVQDQLTKKAIQDMTMGGSFNSVYADAE